MRLDEPGPSAACEASSIERHDLGVDRVLLRLPARFEEAGVEDDGDDAARPRERANHLVGQVARHVGDGAQFECVAMTGCVGSLDDVPEGLVRDVRHVHHHAEPVHLAYDLAAEVVEPARRALGVARRAGPRRGCASTSATCSARPRGSSARRVSSFSSIA